MESKDPEIIDDDARSRATSYDVHTKPNASQPTFVCQSPKLSLHPHHISFGDVPSPSNSKSPSNVSNQDTNVSNEHPYSLCGQKLKMKLCSIIVFVIGIIVLIYGCLIVGKHSCSNDTYICDDDSDSISLMCKTLKCNECILISKNINFSRCQSFQTININALLLIGSGFILLLGSVMVYVWLHKKQQIQRKRESTIFDMNRMKSVKSLYGIHSNPSQQKQLSIPPKIKTRSLSHEPSITGEIKDAFDNDIKNGSTFQQ